MKKQRILKLIVARFSEYNLIFKLSNELNK